MAFVSEMFDVMRDLLTDPSDSQVTFVMKKTYLNRGIARLWPKIWRTVTLDIATSDTTLDYVISPSFVGTSDYEVISVELTDPDSGLRTRLSDYDIIKGDEDVTSIFRFTTGYPPAAGTVHLRLAAAIPFISAVDYTAAQSEAWTGPDRALMLPVWYAMSFTAARKLDDRQDTNRYSTLVAENGVTDNDMMSLAQQYMGQFELELDSMEKMLPPSRD